LIVTAGATESKLDRALERAERETGCRSIVVARRDGLVIAYRLPKGRDARVPASLAASIFGAAEVAVAEFEHAGLSRVIISCASAQIVAQGAGPEAIVIGVDAEGANLGLVLLGLAHLSTEIQEILDAL